MPDSTFLPPVAGAVPVPLAAGETVTVSVWLSRKKSEKPVPAPGDGVSRSDLGANWGADTADVDKVLKHLTKIDKSIKRVETPFALERRLVSFSGPLVSIAKAFDAKVSKVKLPGLAPFLMRTGSLAVPPSLKDIVLGVFGLDQRPVGTRGPSAAVPSSIDPNDLPTPRDIADRYCFPDNEGAGQTIALMQFGGGYVRSDLDTYFTNLGLVTPDVVDVSVMGAANQPGSRYDKEVTLDIEVAGAVANESRLAIYFAPHTEQGWIEAVSTAVMDTTYAPSVMSISWGAPEFGSSNTLTWSANGMDAMEAYFQDAARIDMTVLAASGDDGSNCTVGDGLAHVYYPASDPWVLGCGGTSIPDWIFDPAAETAWALGGGGISDRSAVPDYQKEPGIDLPPSRNTMENRRGVPDIAGYSDPGYAFWIKDHRVILGGTSLAAPLYAAAIARVNVMTGNSVGWLHPVLYKAFGAATPQLRDIDDPVSNGTSNSVSWAPGYYGRTGWDARTGLGVFEPGR